MTTHLCLIHGWAVNGAIFNEFRRRLPEDWHTSAPHLLGHGDNAQDFDLLAAADTMAANLPDNSFVLGWSLGGLVALHIAAWFPERVKGLILCNTFAKFQAAADYPQGLNAHSLQRMTVLFQEDYPKYLRQFLELQLLHNTDRKQIINEILPNTTRYGTPAALQSALAAIEHADARQLLPKIATPTLLLYGGKDAITPPRMGEYLAANLPHAEFHLIDKAAHAPFLSHADVCADVLADWVERVSQA